MPRPLTERLDTNLGEWQNAADVPDDDQESPMAKKKAPTQQSHSIAVSDDIECSIVFVRGQKVLLDEQLAAFYGVETKRIIEAVKRNIARFPSDFMFQLDGQEWESLGSQLAGFGLRSQSATSKSVRRGGRRYAPFVFTEQGVAMLSSVLHSPRAIEVNIQIMRAFVRLRQLLSFHKELADRLATLEREMGQRNSNIDDQFRKVFALLEQLFSPAATQRKPIGFHQHGSAGAERKGGTRDAGARTRRVRSIG
jgi:hypothetical protein